jgi:hypothetical protein
MRPVADNLKYSIETLNLRFGYRLKPVSRCPLDRPFAAVSEYLHSSHQLLADLRQHG